MGTAAHPKNLAIYSVLKPRQSRSKNGCLPCRTKRKKCDEARPVCGSCDKLKLHCSWSAHRSRNDADTRPCKENRQLDLVTSTEAQRHALEPDYDDAHRLKVQCISTNPARSASHSGKQSREAEDSSSLLVQIQDREQYLRRSGIISGYGRPTSGPRDPILVNGGQQAGILFDSFRHMTIPWLMNSNRHQNLILKHVVPLAISNTLVLHTVLAISGTHLLYLTPSVKAVALKHYTAALRGLKQDLSVWSTTQGKEYRILLTTIVLLCYCDYVGGNMYNTVLQHVRASREFVNIALQHLDDPGHQELVVLLVESYGYFTLVANLRGSVPEEDNVVDLGLEFSTSIMPLIQDLPSFGSMFAFEPEGITLVPIIARLSQQSKQERSASVHQQYLAIQTTLQNGRGRQASYHTLDIESTGCMSWDRTQLVLNIKTNTLLIFLGESYHQNHETPIDLMSLLQPLIDDTMMLMDLVRATDAAYCGLFWCFMVVGSFLHDTERQQSLVRKLETIQSHMPCQKKGVELLRWLWEDANQVNCGLTGLEKVAVAHGVGLCIC